MMRISGVMKYIGVLFLICVGSISVSAQQRGERLGQGQGERLGQGQGERLSEWIHNTHEQISNRILDTAEQLDSFFSDERIEDERQTTQISITTSASVFTDKAPIFTFPISMNLALPRLENRVHVVVDTLLQEQDLFEHIHSDGNGQNARK